MKYIKDFISGLLLSLACIYLPPIFSNDRLGIPGANFLLKFMSGGASIVVIAVLYGVALGGLYSIFLRQKDAFRWNRFLFFLSGVLAGFSIIPVAALFLFANPNF